MGSRAPTGRASTSERHAVARSTRRAPPPPSPSPPSPSLPSPGLAARDAYASFVRCSARQAPPPQPFAGAPPAEPAQTDEGRAAGRSSHPVRAMAHAMTMPAMTHTTSGGDGDCTARAGWGTGLSVGRPRHRGMAQAKGPGEGRAQAKRCENCRVRLAVPTTGGGTAAVGASMRRRAWAKGCAAQRRWKSRTVTASESGGRGMGRSQIGSSAQGFGAGGRGALRTSRRQGQPEGWERARPRAGGRWARDGRGRSSAGRRASSRPTCGAPQAWRVRAAAVAVARWRWRERHNNRRTKAWRVRARARRDPRPAGV